MASGWASWHKALLPSLWSSGATPVVPPVLPGAAPAPKGPGPRGHLVVPHGGVTSDARLRRVYTSVWVCDSPQSYAMTSILHAYTADHLVHPGYFLSESLRAPNRDPDARRRAHSAAPTRCQGPVRSDALQSVACGLVPARPVPSAAAADKMKACRHPPHAHGWAYLTKLGVGDTMLERALQTVTR